MAVGEAACVSVHGANRLGSNSLLDLVVFGRAAANRCAETVDPGEQNPSAAQRCRREGLDRLDQLRHADGETPTARSAPGDAAVMQNQRAVFRTGETWTKACEDEGETWRSAFADVKVSDRSMIWNTDLVETLELDNLLAQAMVTINVGRQPQGKPRRARARGLSRARRRELDEAHAGLVRRRRQGADRLPPGAHEPLTNEVESFPPKARVY